MGGKEDAEIESIMLQNMVTKRNNEQTLQKTPFPQIKFAFSAGDQVRKIWILPGTSEKNQSFES